MRPPQRYILLSCIRLSKIPPRFRGVRAILQALEIKSSIFHSSDEKSPSRGFFDIFRILLLLLLNALLLPIIKGHKQGRTDENR